MNRKFGMAWLVVAVVLPAAGPRAETWPAARFNFTVTDPTPPPVFYLLQQPQRLIAHSPIMGARLADLAIP